jgi:hypothetical protein
MVPAGIQRGKAGLAGISMLQRTFFMLQKLLQEIFELVAKAYLLLLRLLRNLD